MHLISASSPFLTNISDNPLLQLLVPHRTNESQDEEEHVDDVEIKIESGKHVFLWRQRIPGKTPHNNAVRALPEYSNWGKCAILKTGGTFPTRKRWEIMRNSVELYEEENNLGIILALCTQRMKYKINKNTHVNILFEAFANSWSPATFLF